MRELLISSDHRTGDPLTRQFITYAPSLAFPHQGSLTAGIRLNRTSTLLLLVFGLMLLAAIGVQVYQATAAEVFTPRPPLSQTLPVDLPGWTSRELPLGETEETKNAVMDILKFDDYFSRSYRSGSTEVSLYVAYWQPDKVPPRAVGVHTPDTCWVQNGWTRLDRAHAVPLATLAGHALKPAEFGTYSLRGNTQQVYFWHLVGGKPYSYEQEGLHSLTAPLQDMATFGLNQRRDQLFVRLAANVPFDQVWREPGLTRLLEALATLGLALPPPDKT